jgi:hypothetical protein
VLAAAVASQGARITANVPFHSIVANGTLKAEQNTIHQGPSADAVIIEAANDKGLR